jgi:hypothetical protein
MTWGLRPVSDLPPFQDGKPFCRSRLSLGVARLLARSLLALVLDVDSLLVIVDEDLRHKPAVVVESLRPLRDILASPQN